MQYERIEGFRLSRSDNFEEAKDSSDDPTYRKQMDDIIAKLRSRLEAENSVEQEMQAKEVELDNALENPVLQAGRH
jgi:hypothetical protein